MVGRKIHVGGAVVAVVAVVLVARGSVGHAQSPPSTPLPRYAPLLEGALNGGEPQVLPPAYVVSAARQPANLIVPEALRPLVRRMWENSPTFRAQCQRIAGAPSLTVRVHAYSQRPASLASTQLVHSPAGLVAYVYVERLSRAAELLAHELEHVIERVDGVDVVDVAERAPTMAWRTDGGYETRRAIHAGRTVAREMVETWDRSGS